MGILRFAKGHGTANDFVLVPDRYGERSLSPELARALCDRRTGIGADGVIRVAPAEESGAWFMDHYNADGSAPEMCGNGIRVFGRFLVDQGWAGPGLIRVQTHGGWRSVDVAPSGDVSVNMGPAVVDQVERKITVVGQVPVTGLGVDLGNPHVVGRTPAELDSLDFEAAPEVSPAFLHGVNVELVELPERADVRQLRMRVFERGVGETSSCGTGACAAAAAAAVWSGDGAEWEWLVRVRGGQLRVRSDGRDLHLVGPAVLVATGEVELSALGF